VLFQAFEITLDGIPNVRHGFVASFSLRNATGQGRTFCDKQAIFIGLNYDPEFHAATVTLLQTFARCDSAATAIPIRHPLPLSAINTRYFLRV
jgi:hypothetical protein